MTSYMLRRRLLPGLLLAGMMAIIGFGWPTYHLDNIRSGLDASFPATSRLSAAWSKGLDGAVYASPVVAGGKLLVATENNTVYGFNPPSGRQLWSRHLGAPVPPSRLGLGAGCGNINPLGITGTPAYDGATNRVFVVTETKAGASVLHTLVGLDPATGNVTLSRLVQPPRGNSAAHQQRGALLVANSRVYVPYGGLLGDCDNYVGSVVASRTDGAGGLESFAVPTARQGGIWTPPGPSSDAAGNIYVQVGNSASTNPAHYDYGDSVLKLTFNLKLNTADKAFFFSPASWARDNAVDADLGSSGPALTANGFVLAAGKSGTAYVLRQSRLGGVGGQVTATRLCAPYGGDAINGSSVYLPCTDGVAAVVVRNDGTLQRLWKAPANINGSPVIGGAGLFVSSRSDQRLYALDRSTGAVKASIPVGPITRFATPALSNGMVFLGTSGGVTAIRVR